MNSMIKNILFYFLIFITIFCGNLNSQNKAKPAIRCKYLLYLPKNYESDSRDFPLIIYLHGGSQRGNDLNKLKTYGLPYLIDKGHEYDFIIASPQCPDTSFWSQINWFDSLYIDLISKYRIDKNRIYLTGISMGGFGAWHGAMDHPDKFAALIPLCGGCNDSLDICRINKIPVWTFHGTSDTIIYINETERLVNRLTKCNGNVKFTRLENKGHAIFDVFEKPEIYEWLKQNIKKP
jgi:predicted peptidase